MSPRINVLISYLNIHIIVINGTVAHVFKVYRDNASTISTRRNLLDDMDTIDDYDHSDVLEAVEEEQQDRGPDIVDQTAYSPLRPSTIRFQLILIHI